MDTLPVLTTASGADLGKSFSGPNLRPLPFQTSKHFTVEELLVHDLPSMIDVLQSLEGKPTKTVIRGKVPSDASEIISRDKETIMASPRSWCMIDIDAPPKTSTTAQAPQHKHKYVLTPPVSPFYIICR